MTRTKLVVTLTFILMLILSACTTQAPTAAPTVEPTAAPVVETAAPTEAPVVEPTSTSFTVTDALDREVTFDAVPSKIVLNGKALFMVADAIYLFPEAGSNIAALGPTNQGESNFIPLIDPTFEAKISLAKDATVEDIAAVNPDLVILKSSTAETLGAPLEEIGIKVVYVDFETAEQYKRDLATLGEIFQNPAQAEKLAGYFQDKVDAVTTALSALTEEDKPDTLLLYYSDKDGTISFNVPPMGWMQTYMIQTAGGNAIWEDANPADGWTTVNLEQVAAWNPEHIFIVSYFVPVADVITTIKADPQWMLLDAVKNNQVYGFASDVYSWDQPDPRWILGLNWVASKIHPDLFPEYDTVTDARAFYKDLYGMDDAAFEQNILPLLKGDIN